MQFSENEMQMPWDLQLSASRMAKDVVCELSAWVHIDKRGKRVEEFTQNPYGPPKLNTLHATHFKCPTVLSGLLTYLFISVCLLMFVVKD